MENKPAVTKRCVVAGVLVAWLVGAHFGPQITDLHWWYFKSVSARTCPFIEEPYSREGVPRAHFDLLTLRFELYTDCGEASDL